MTWGTWRAPFWLALALEAAGGGALAGYPRKLIARTGAAFKVLQLTDVHLGEDPGGTWGPAQDEKSLEVIERVLDAEQPDLVVLNGDSITSEELQGDADVQEYWHRLVTPLRKRSLPWVMVFGNHEDCHTRGCHHVTQGRAKDLEDVDAQASEEKQASDAEVMQVLLSQRRELMAGRRLRAARLTPEQREQLAEKKAARIAAREEAKAAKQREKENKARLEEALGQGVKEMYPTDQDAKKAEAPYVREEKAEQAAEEDVQKAEQRQEKRAMTKASKASKAFKDAAPPSRWDLSPAEFGEAEPLQGHILPPSRSPEGLQAVPEHAARRDALLQFDRKFALSRTAAEGVFVSQGGGLSNYFLRVYDSALAADEDRPSAILWFLDSGGGSYQERLHADQVEWLQRSAAALQLRYGQLPAALYMHIPSRDYLLPVPGASQACFGDSDDFVTPMVSDAQLMTTLADANINWIFTGHNHGNDWCCPISAKASMGYAVGIELCFGRHSGFGGYATPGMHSRGARVLQLDLGGGASRGARPGIRTWVRLESGEMVGSSPGR